VSLRLPFLVLAGASLVTLAGCVVAANSETLITSSPLAETLLAPEPPLSDLGLGEADGYVPVGVWLTLADDVPAITNLDADLRAALEAAAVAAQERGTELSFTDAWRSSAYQQHIFDDAVLKYGSEEEARRWVKPADESEHVVGRAVDIATADAMDFLSRFGAEFGLCQIYANEAWHYEYVPDVTEECPAQLTDSTS
jgi:D-alanyl-D-alanine carboxypeptidase